MLPRFLISPKQRLNNSTNVLSKQGAPNEKLKRNICSRESTHSKTLGFCNAEKIHNQGNPGKHSPLHFRRGYVYILFDRNDETCLRNCTGAPDEKIVQNHLNIALLNIF